MTLASCARCSAVAPRLAVIGAGFIGLEIAATARQLGADVTVVEAAAFPLSGVLGHGWAAGLPQLHRAEGVDVRTGVTVDRVRSNGAVRALRLSDGSVSRRRSRARRCRGRARRRMACRLLAWTPVTACRSTSTDGQRSRTYSPPATRLPRSIRAPAATCPGSHWEAAARQGVRVGRVMLGLDPGPTPIYELLDRPVRLEDPVRRQRRAVRTRSRSTETRTAATSPRSLPGPGALSPRCS